jgi:hypothetical protein
MKKIVIYIILFTTNFVYSYEIPTIAIVDLFYKKNKSSTIIYQSISDESGKIKNVIHNDKIKNSIIKNFTMFNTSIKGKLTQTKNFKVVEYSKINNLWHGNTEPILNYISHIKNSESILRESYINIPNYILIGEITSFNNNTNIEPIKDTNKQTIQFNLDVNISYNLISTKDNVIISAFNVLGHADEIKIINENSTNQKINPNMTNLIRDISNDLSNNIVDEINKNFAVTNKNYKTESIESFTIYN